MAVITSLAWREATGCVRADKTFGNAHIEKSKLVIYRVVLKFGENIFNFFFLYLTR